MIIRCEFIDINSKYQMHRNLRKLSSPNTPALLFNIQIIEGTLGKSCKAFFIYVKSRFVNF